MKHIRSEATRIHNDGTILKLAQSARKLEEVQCLFERNCLYALICMERSKERFLAFVCRTQLNHRAETTNFHADCFSRCGINAEFSFAHFMLCFLIENLLHLRFKAGVEVAHQFMPVLLSFSHMVEIFFHFGCKVIVHNFGEELCKKIVHNKTHICWNELLLFRSERFLWIRFADAIIFQLEHIHFSLFACLIASGNIFTLLYGGNRRSIGRRTPNTQFFEFVYEGCFIIAKRSRSETLLRNNFLAFQHIAFVHFGKQLLLFFIIFFVVALTINAEETIKLHNLSCRNKTFVSIGANTDFNGCSLQLCIGHLARNSTFPNKAIETFLLNSTRYFLVVHVCRANCLMGFLRSLSTGMISAAFVVLFPRHLLNHWAASVQTQVAQIHRVGTHIGDKTAFVETLCHAHRLCNGEPKFARCLLLQR